MAYGDLCGYALCPIHRIQYVNDRIGCPACAVGATPHIDYIMTNQTIKVTALKLNLEELIVIYRLLEHQYIPYENEAAHAVVNKIAKVVNDQTK